ncbi:hypothetical protein V6N13_058122 [Hibiscus sabdariffa]|uniref:Uncharacterized protein n=1 Tax=Hibiscus sabdariffa TaxID=183260 RepID=A0ABR2GH30_9ROSI
MKNQPKLCHFSNMDGAGSGPGGSTTPLTAVQLHVPLLESIRARLRHGPYRSALKTRNGHMHRGRSNSKPGRKPNTFLSYRCAYRENCWLSVFSLSAVFALIILSSTSNTFQHVSHVMQL